MSWQIEQNIERIRREKAAGTYVPPVRKPKPVDPDDEPDEPERLGSEWARRQRQAVVATHATSPPIVEVPAEYRHYLAPPPPQPKKKIGPSPMAHLVEEKQSNWRRCEAKDCAMLTDGMSSLCKLHLWRRRRYGSTQVNRDVRYKDYQPFVEVAAKYLQLHRWAKKTRVNRILQKKNDPVPPDVLESMERFLQPPAPILKGRDGYKARELVIREMTRWQDPKFRRKYVHVPYGHQKPANYSARGYLCILVAVRMYLEEREYRGFPDDAEGFVFARALCRMHIRPGSVGISAKKAKLYPPGQAKLQKYTQRPVSSILEGIAKRLREFTTVGVYVLETARMLLAEWQKTQTERNKALSLHKSSTENTRVATPGKPAPEQSPAPLRFEFPDEEEKSKLPVTFEERKAAFDAEVPPPAPGPRPVVPEPKYFWEQDKRIKEADRAWFQAVEAYDRYMDRRREFYSEK